MSVAPRVVHVYPDHGAYYPLWDNNGRRYMGDDPAELERVLGVGCVLLNALAGWQRAWEEIRDKSAADQHDLDGLALLRRLESESTTNVSFVLGMPDSPSDRADKPRHLLADRIWVMRHGVPPESPLG